MVGHAGLGVEEGRGRASNHQWGKILLSLGRGYGPMAPGHATAAGRRASMMGGQLRAKNNSQMRSPKCQIPSPRAPLCLGSSWVVAPFVVSFSQSERVKKSRFWVCGLLHVGPAESTTEPPLCDFAAKIFSRISQCCPMLYCNAKLMF